MTREEAILYLEHTSSDDFNLEEQQIQNRLNAIQFLLKENQQLKDKLSKIETLIINHNCDTGDIYYKYNSKFLKSELKQRILEIVCKKEVIVMDNDTLADYWRDVSPILKQQAQEKRENCFNNRLEYAKKQFEKNDIPYKLCNETIGHFNLLDSKRKVLMSFWSYTGKLYIPSTGFSDNVGIRNCIRKYKKIVESDSNE